jgi:DNA polymerase-1
VLTPTTCLGYVPSVREIDAAIIPMLSRMERVGMMVDRPATETFAGELEHELDEIRDRLSGLLGSKTNPNSPKMADVLFRQLKLPVIKLTKAKTREAIDDDVLGALKAQLKKRPDSDDTRDLAIQVIDCITDYRERQKLLSTYCLPLLDKLDSDSRVHTTLKYTHVATGRLSSEDPNLQNIPNPDNSPVYGKRMRSLFIARPGYKLISADYSQIEMVVGAHITQDPGMLRVFRDGLDLHYYAASLMFDIPYDQVPKATRTQVKPLNFGAFYGLSAMGLQAQFASLPSGAIEKTEEECQELIDRYYSAFSSVMEWKRALWKWGQINGYVETLFGRKRQMPGLRSNIGKIRAAAERESGNQPIQGTAQDILRIGMRTLWEDSLPMFWAEGIDIQAINQVHDEILFEVEERAAEWVVPTIESAMRYAVGLSVPIKVGISVAENWAALK